MTSWDLLQTLLVHTIYMTFSWYYFFELFIAFQTDDPDVETELSKAKTYMAVALVSFFVEQFINSCLVPLAIVKQREFVEISNRIQEMERDLPDLQENELRGLFIFTLASQLYFLVSFTIFGGMSAGSLRKRLFQIVSLMRPVISDCVSLQFISIVLLLNNRIRRLNKAVEEQRIPLEMGRSIHSVLWQLGECLGVANQEFSLIFLLQSTRLIITVDNDIYQLVVIVNSELLESLSVVLMFVGVLVAYSLGVYLSLVIICHRTQIELESLSRTCERRVMVKSSSELSLHFMHQRRQRHGHGFGLTAFGILDVDLKGVLLVRKILCA